MPWQSSSWLSKSNQERSIVKKAVDLDLNALTRRTAMTRTGGKKFARLLLGLSFHAPFLGPRDQHPGVE